MRTTEEISEIAAPFYSLAPTSSYEKFKIKHP